MIRTRDLVIFVGVLCFLLLGIAVTLLQDSSTQLRTLMWNPEVLSTNDEEYVGEADTKEINRDDVITRLRNALAAKQPDVVPQPSVEESEESVSEEDVEAVQSGVQYCSNYDDSQDVMRSWPLRDVSLVVDGTVREVIHTTSVNVVPNASSSTSTPTSQTRTLISFATYPMAGEESCVPGEVVGVTSAGSLMFNGEVALYRGYGPEYLIGYARDGFPIYGFYQGEVDACGGYMHPSGYRYSITPNREYVLGCYKGTPATFVGF